MKCGEKQIYFFNNKIVDIIKITIDNATISIILSAMKSGRDCFKNLLYIRYVIVDNDKSIKDTAKICFNIVGMMILLLIIAISHTKNSEIITTKAKINNSIFFIFNSIQKFV